MRRQKLNISARSQLALTVLILTLCLLLVIGSAWARYQVSETSFLNYAAKEYASIFLWSGYDEATKVLTDGENSWETSGELKTLRFYVSNGSSDDYSADSQQAYIRLNAALGVRNGEENMKVMLGIAQEDGSPMLYYEGTPQLIAENTPLHKSFGAGWVFTFRDKNGKELGWTLEGGDLSVISAQLVIEGIDLQDPTLLQLQVSGEPA